MLRRNKTFNTKMVSICRKKNYNDINVNNNNKLLIMNKYAIVYLIVILILNNNINHVSSSSLYSSQSFSTSNIDVYQNHNYHHPHRTPFPSSNPKMNFENAYKDAISDVRSLFKKQHDNFDSFFRQILKSSHSDFHRMFSDTYGILYDRHSFIFNNMFRDLEQYYNEGNIDLTESMREFFSLLYKKMFEELNAQYTFDAAYLNCTVEHMEEMMPFGELPQKLILQVRRSFVAIRTFVQALKYGSDILKTVMELPVTSSCENRLRSISYCPRCERTNNHIPICQTSCINSIEKSCLPFNNNLNREWNKYLNDMVRLASRLKTSFNIEHIVSPIHIQISDAIMNFQENGRTISSRLFNKCGKPTHRKREKRSDGGYDFQRMPPQLTSTKPRQQQPQQQLNIFTIIDAMANDFKALKNFWTILPKKLCSHYSTSEKCLSNDTFRMGDDFNYRDKNNVEIMNQQISTLKLISNNLNNAYNGLDVDFETDNNAPIDDEISGSGDEDSSGSGFIDDTIQNKNPIYQHNSSTSNDDILIISSTLNPPLDSDDDSDDDSSNTKIITLVKPPSPGSGCYCFNQINMLSLWISVLISLLYLFH